MSRDPFEELFGADGADAPKPAAAPVPARERLAYEQAERVRTAQLPAGKRKSAATAAQTDDRAARAKPWIVVGIIAVLALVASIVVVNVARGSQEAPQQTTPPATTQSPTTPQRTTPPTSGSDADDEEDDKPAGPPAVDVGPTYDMAIVPWNATSQISQRFGSISFTIPDGTNLVLSSDLLNSFPESCAAMRQGWGATKTATGYEVLKPAERCEAAPELYDEVWGLTAAWVQTIR